MSFWRKLFGGGQEHDCVISGSDIGQHITTLADRALKDGWDPVGSIHIQCCQCSFPVRLTHGPVSLGAELLFLPSAGGFKKLRNPLTCEKCSSTTFRVTLERKTFTDVLRAAVDNLPPCVEDPTAGFLCDETSTLIPDHGFQSARSFEDVWSHVGRYIGEKWGMNKDYEFDIITDSQRRSRYIKPVRAVCHYNGDKDCLVVLFRDSAGRYWYHHERH